uniref:Chymotrypsin-like protease-3 n=1 Tax=Mesobuthus eupeus TaxID=34648 RepID=E4VP23_MESEU|nr:chymotrypsin-like protease-3 [Mesobuthus eupeus]
MKSFILILFCLKFSLQVPLKDLKEEGRILGGTFAKNGEYPWMVVIDLPDTACGGVSISKKFVLTAAHCVYDDDNTKIISNKELNVIAGDVSPGKGKFLPVSEIYTYNGYIGNWVNDIAILKLKNNAPIDNKNVKTICLSDKGYDLEDQTPVIQLGWGEFAKDSEFSQTLKVTNKGFYLKNTTCRQATGKWTDRGHLCVAKSDGDRTCHGDSGGPMVITKGNQKISAGVLSFSYQSDCILEKTKPTMFTDVRYHAQWIKTQTKDKTICWVQK